MYQDMKCTYWWLGVKSDVTDFVSKCLTCQQVKIKHQLPNGLLKQLLIGSKECVSCDFVSGLPKSRRKNDFICVVLN